MVAISKIIQLLQPVKVIGNADKEVLEILPSDDYALMKTNSLTWLGPKKTHEIHNFKLGIIICADALDESQVSEECTVLVVDNPRRAFAQLINSFFKEEESAYIHPTVIIGNSVKLGNNVSIGPNTVIGDETTIGDNVIIGANNVIKRRTIIENDVKIGSNNTIGDAGFGYEKNEAGDYERINHIGNVVIKKKVEISNNTCIDRAVLGSTIIGENSKIDNLVHIAHGVKIDQNTLIIANSMIAGSTKIGDNVWIAPSVSVLNKLTIENESVVGMGAVVLKNIDASEVVVGNPGKVIRKK